VQNPTATYPSAASTSAAVLFIGLALLISGCGQTTDNPAPATVLSAPQQGLNSAQQMEQQLQKDVERREQQMRDQDI